MTQKNETSTGALAGILTFLLLFSNAVPAQEAEKLTDSEVEALVAEIKAGYELAKETLKDFRSDRLSTDVAIEQANFEAEAIFTWLESNVRWVPYRGTLKGVTGTLASRQGNALDRSLLLAELLEQAGYETRLARTTLDTVVSKTLVDRELVRSVPVGIHYDLTEFGQDIVDRATQQTEQLSKMVGAPMPFDYDALYSATADHWWVQVSIDDNWTDFDPLFSAEFAADRPDPQSFLSSDRIPEDLPPELYHRVTIRIVIERFDAGALVRETPVQHTIVTSDDLAQPLDIDFIPFDADQPTSGQEWNANPAELAAAADSWLPIISTNGKRITDYGFTISGKLYKNPAKPTQHRKVEKATAAIGNLNASAESAEPGSVLTGAWIEYEIERPGEAAQLIPRKLFNIMTPASHRGTQLTRPDVTEKDVLTRGLALMMRSQVLVVNGEPPLEAFDQGMLKLWAETGNLIAGIVRIAHDPTAEEPRQRLAGGSVYPMDLLALATFREVLTRHAGATYLEQANIFSNHYMYLEDGAGPFHAMDIVFNENAVFPINGYFLIQMNQGVLDTILESALLPGSESRHNTSVLYERRDETGPWLVVHQSNLQELKLPHSTLADIDAALAAGFVVLAPSQLPAGTRGAWWRIDRQNGSTLGIGRWGWGADLTETVGVHTVLAEAEAVVAKYSGQAVCAGVAVGVTAVAVATNIPFHYTQPSIMALAKPLLRTHCGVVGWWIPP